MNNPFPRVYPAVIQSNTAIMSIIDTYNGYFFTYIEDRYVEGNTNTYST
jgi:hypothetical protein